MESEGRYAEVFADRQSHADAVLRSPAARKIVVAGPGTGKTYLFEQVLKDKPKTWIREQCASLL